MLLVLVCLIIHNSVGDHDNSRYIQHIDNFHTTLPNNKTVTQFTLQFYTVNCNNIIQGWIQDFFKGGLGDNSYIIFKNYSYIYCNSSHCYFNQQSACKYLLCMKLQPTRCCSCSYYALMLLYICTVIYSLA